MDLLLKPMFCQKWTVQVSFWTVHFLHQRIFCTKWSFDFWYSLLFTRSNSCAIFAVFEQSFGIFSWYWCWSEFKIEHVKDWNKNLPPHLTPPPTAHPSSHHHQSILRFSRVVLDFGPPTTSRSLNSPRKECPISLQIRHRGSSQGCLATPISTPSLIEGY